MDETLRTALRRLPARGSYDLIDILSNLDP